MRVQLSSSGVSVVGEELISICVCKKLDFFNLFNEICYVAVQKSTALSGGLRGSKGFKLQHVHQRTRGSGNSPPKNKIPQNLLLGVNPLLLFTPKTINCPWPPTDTRGLDGI